MPVVCPSCGSRHLRYSHRHGLAEHLWSLLGVRPLRCRDCRVRFVERTWRLTSIKYARCPACWRMDLNKWSREDFHASTGQRLRLWLGGRPYRCEYCRVNFVSFRPRLEKFTFRRWAKRRKEAQEEPEAGASGQAQGVGESGPEAAGE